MKLTGDDIGIIAHGEPTHWYVSIFDEGNSRESVEQLKQQILSDNKLRELFESFFNGDNVMVKKEYKKILEDSKK